MVPRPSVAINAAVAATMARWPTSQSPNTASNPYEQLVDLATALEAALIGAERETEGLTLRLRSRVAALLATDDDPARALFDDVNHLYGLRSKLVHGGQITQIGPPQEHQPHLDRSRRVDRAPLRGRPRLRGRPYA